MSDRHASPAYRRDEWKAGTPVIHSSSAYTIHETITKEVGWRVRQPGIKAFPVLLIGHRQWDALRGDPTTAGFIDHQLGALDGVARTYCRMKVVLMPMCGIMVI